MLSIEKRQLIVQLHNKGRNQQEIAELIECSQPTVSLWIKRSLRKDGLKTRKRSGRPTKLTPAKLSNLRDVIKRKIEAKNENFGSLTTKQLSNIIYNNVGILYSIRHVERLMHKLGFSLITPRTQHIKHNQENVDNFRDEFKKNFNKSIWVMKL